LLLFNPMHRLRHTLLVVTAGAVLFACCRTTLTGAAISSSTPAPQLQLTRISALLKDPQRAAQQASNSPIEFGWNLFVFVNWPALPNARGVPDPSKHLGTAEPVVWQTWKTAPEVYVAPGQTPLPWNLGLSGTPVLAQTEIDGQTLLDDDNNPVMYQVLMNQGVFDYLISRRLYSFAGQEAARGTPGGPVVAPVQFPANAMEVKASWRILDPITDKARMSHYLTQRVTYVGSDGSALQLVVGLTGLHITSKALPNWFWVTFEQNENATTTQTKHTLPIAPDVAAANATMQRLFAGTVWQYYRMDGYQTGYGAADKPTLLANSQMETNFQSSSSCMTCHSLASIGALKPGPPRFPFFNNMQGYTGAPPTAPFGSGPGQFTPLDFVWSMREAQQ